MKHVSGNRHTVIDELSHQSKIEEEDEEKKDIENFINSQLNCVKISVLELDETENEILEPEYSLKHQQIVYYLTLLQKLIVIPQASFKDFRKRALWYLVQDGHLFRQQD